MSRTQFEAWFAKSAGEHPSGTWFARNAEGQYLNVGVYFAWKGWQAREQAGPLEVRHA